MKEEVAELQRDNYELSEALADVEHELDSACTDKVATCAGDVDFSIQMKYVRRYSPVIRKLYYTLLADQVPVSKISEIVKTVVQCFNPSIDVQHLKLPQRACAGYMRKDELKTISNAHKA